MTASSPHDDLDQVWWSATQTQLVPSNQQPAARSDDPNETAPEPHETEQTPDVSTELAPNDHTEAAADNKPDDRWAAFSSGLAAMRWTKTDDHQTPTHNTRQPHPHKTHSVNPFAQQDNPQRAVRSRWQQWSELGSRWSDEAWHDLGEAAHSVSTWTHRTWAQMPQLIPGRTARHSSLEQAVLTQTTYEWCGADVTESPIGSLTGEVHKIQLTDGSEIHAEIDEPDNWDPTQPTIVFAHGYALSRDSWHFQRQTLQGHYRMVFWDQRGHGLSQNVDLTNMSIDLLGQDLWTVINQTCPTGPIILVGHSMGGMTVMAAAAARPDILEERVVGVALVATSPSHLRHNTFGWGLAGAVVQRATPAALQALATIPRVTRRTRNAISAAEEFMVKRYSFASEVPTEVADSVVRMIRETTVPVLAAFMDKFDDHDKRAALSLFNRTETLVLVGDQDVMTPQSYSDRIVRRIPHAEYVVVQQAGHMVAMEHPDLVTDHLRDFLRRATQG